MVGDERDDLATLLRQALARTDLIVLTGGLGPTDDDLTRDVVAEVLELPIDDRRVDRRRRSARASSGAAWSCPRSTGGRRMVPRGAIVLDNPNGTAPGLLHRLRRRATGRS